MVLKTAVTSVLGIKKESLINFLSQFTGIMPDGGLPERPHESGQMDGRRCHAIPLRPGNDKVRSVHPTSHVALHY